MNKESSNQYFIAYDIFGYLIPGLVFIGITAKANTWWMDHVVRGRCSGNAADTVILLGFAYVVGHVISAISSFFVERIVLRKIFGYPSNVMFPETSSNIQKTTKQSIWFQAWSVICWLIRRLKLLAAFAIRVNPQEYLRPYSSDFQLRVRNQFEQTFGFQPKDTYDLFWLTWSYVAMHNEVCFKRAMHFVNLYGFARNISLTLLFAAVLPYLPYWNADLEVSSKLWCWSCLAVSLIMFSNYAKLMRRSNSEIYRAFVAMTSPTPEGIAKEASDEK